jgi:aspartyl-tRNA(Asn)/glutamyl-tRNA(Gln) amidotransferase subunit B
MSTDYEAVIGLEIHAELATNSKMFCACPVVDSTHAIPNDAVCPVCAGMPGVLPVVNQRAVEYGLRVALALECEIACTSIFARKNYFYPDLPKGYQISQYEQPLASNGHLNLYTRSGERTIGIRRVHLEEDTGKLTHAIKDGKSYSLIDLNRAGIPLLEIVSEPDLHTAEEVHAYATAIRSLMRYLGVNTGDMEKGVLRIEPNVSIHKVGNSQFGIRTEIKNLNSFRALERSVDFEIHRQTELLEQGKPVIQETRGWEESLGITVPQRGKEEAHDYRYFPEPDLPPLVVETEWIEQLRASQPELPAARLRRFQKQYGISVYDAGRLTIERKVADYFEAVLSADANLSPKNVANWICGELFGLVNQAGAEFHPELITPPALAQLLGMISRGEINQGTGKLVLAEMFASGKPAEIVVKERNLRQVSDTGHIAELVSRILAENPEQVQIYLKGKETIARWLFGQVMRLTRGTANPQVVQDELERQLISLKERS